MGSNERREREKEIRRKDIIDAAERVFFTKGYNAATMDDVSKEAEYSKRTVYVYFNSKEQIYFEIMIRGYRLMLEMLRTHIKKSTEPGAIEEIKNMASLLFRFSNEHPQYFAAIMEYENSVLDFQNGIPDKSREECYALGEELLGFFIGLLKKGVTEGSVRQDLDIMKTALSLWACILGVFNTANKKKYYIENYHGITSEELVSSAFKLMITAIQNSGEDVKC